MKQSSRRLKLLCYLILKTIGWLLVAGCWLLVAGYIIHDFLPFVKCLMDSLTFQLFYIVGFNTPTLERNTIIETVLETFGYTTQQKLPKEAWQRGSLLIRFQKLQTKWRKHSPWSDFMWRNAPLV
jgi:hypothetical protein